MFTGIVSAVGKVVATGGSRLGIDHAAVARKVRRGSSVAVNGVCLTIVRIRGPVFYADVVPETRRRTNLGALKDKSEVNLELPLVAGGTLDGHLVQGHVDTTATVQSVEQAATGRYITVQLPASISRYVAEKGSIAIDGVSLTIASVARSAFTVALIPHTLEATIAGHYRRGSVVNLEADVIARYVVRNLRR